MNNQATAPSFGARVHAILKRRGLGELAIMMLDRVVRPFGISPISYTRFAEVPGLSTASSADARFEEIAAENHWGSSESLSGKGSEVRQSAAYRERLVAFLREAQIHSMFDAPCGDMNWMKLVLSEVEINYHGGDISDRVIALNKARFPDLDFRVIDITADTFPEVDVWHCRDCLFHLSYEEIFKALRNFAGSGLPAALITNHPGKVRNIDIKTGGWRYLNLERAPFNLPKPSTYLKDYRFGDLPRKIGYWSREAIAHALDGQN